MSEFLVFVYGTLKRGQPNFAQFSSENGSAVFKGSGKTCDKYPLVIGSKYNIPFLLLKPGTGHNVTGELIKMDSRMLQHCDVFEGHPDFYERLETNITLTTDENDVTLSEPQIISCWCYFLKKYKPEMLNLPQLESYASTEEQRYIGNESIESVEEIWQ